MTYPSAPDNVANSSLEATLFARLEHLISTIAVEAHADELAHICNLKTDYARLLLDTYCNEARVGLRLIAPVLRPGQRLLEIGSGIGLLARTISGQGYDITGVEPGTSGFGFMPTLSAIVARCMPTEKPFQPLDLLASQLDPDIHGAFDLIYSVNVVEHIVDLDASIAAMARVLAPGGTMVHMCPNYTVPYEPHLAIPLLPFVPSATKHLFLAKTRLYPGLWEGLNFVTAGRLRKLAGQNGLSIHFDKGIMGMMIRRILQDPVFSSRQGRAVSLMAKVIDSLGALRLIDHLPPDLATPMVSRFTKPLDDH
jgi:2-polyprenyl-3-methyl-5-hydroxy-6-metoxy-1,4-benzoquinol methylase